MKKRSVMSVRCGEMYRAGAEAAGHEGGVGHGCHGALAIGAGHVQRCEAALGVAEGVAEARDVLEPELDAERFEREQAVEQFSVTARARRRP